MKTTKELARELGLLRKRYMPRVQNGKQDQTKKPKLCIGQVFSYLVVLDFESTCWQDGKFRTQEIIEFPAVLCNTRTGQIESEFHHYVQPHEQPVLSDFCKQLTGITQMLRRILGSLLLDVIEGPVAFNIHFCYWDLGVCLLYEARRKQLPRPPEMNSWIDLRATYRKFYGRKPHGLNGALQAVGIEFEGREHSGVDDARNTARLAWRMMRDGCIMNVTKNIGMAASGQDDPHTVGGDRSHNGRHGTHISPSITVSTDQSSEPLNSVRLKHSGKLLQTKLQLVNQSPDGRENVFVVPQGLNTCRSSVGLSVRDTNIGCDNKQGDKKCVQDVKNGWPTCQGKKPESGRCVDIGTKMSSVVTAGSSCSKTSLRNSCVELQITVLFVEALSPQIKVLSPGQSGRRSVSTSDVVSRNVFKTPNQRMNRSGESLSRGVTTPNENTFKTPSPLQNRLSVPGSNCSSMKATPPMCKCGRRSKRRLVQSPGPNIGRFFFTCGVRTSQYDVKRGCEFFKWESLSAGGGNSRHVSKTGSGSGVSKPFTPVTPVGVMPKSQQGVRSAVPKYIR
ncbi:LOW QUALITY PROTEIN: ERI1 exoribonuclease 2-like [Haliotis rubra]|uniref:LOW QUALITY PROTEIN: ERI1 exoribonuclease 2-like n=1 Tax=Haliotis rubra TaxID=36100 RepID=UPI001EE55E75|nr:LOW QUALITY PROTEIN: ERI1 exoribonuclease 2-like [Haliotis rubra]